MARRYVWALYERNSVQLDSNGAGTIRFSPGGARERWLINLVAVNCTQLTTLKTPTMLTYRGAPVAPYQIGGTYSAVLDSNTDPTLMNMNEDFYCVFSGGDAGAIGTVRLEGSRYVWE